jgi:hypothetical protein
MRRRTEMHPVSGLNDRHELLAFFHGEYREIQRLIRRFRVCGAEDSYSSYSPFIAAERECNNSVCGRNPLPKAQNVTPAAVAHAPEELRQVCHAIGLFIHDHCSEYGIRVIAKTALANRAPVENAAKFPGNDAFRRTVRIYRDSGHLHILVLPYKVLEKIAATAFIVGK